MFRSDTANPGPGRAILSTLRARLLAIVAALAATLLVISGSTLAVGLREQAATRRAELRSRAIGAELVPLLQAIRDLQIDIVQVQQFLTDASATHHQDSFADAERYSRDFAVQARTIRTLVGRLHREGNGAALAGMGRALDGVTGLFPRYHDLGVAMAHVNIDQGLAPGNARMAQFDPLADQMFHRMDRLMARVRGLIGTSLGRQLAEVRAARGLSATLGHTVAVLALFGLGVCAVAFWAVIVAVTRPLGRMTGAMRGLAAGEADIAIPGADRRDEIGQMAAALAVFRDNARARRELERAQVAAADRAMAERRAAVRAMAETVEREARQGLETVSGHAAAMAADADRLAGAAAHVGEDAAEVATAANQALANAQAVGAASEELAASIREIAGQVAQASRITSRAVEGSETVRARIASLSEAAERIGDVVRLIGDIAGQTNLLALNATIEAARAGESGKGFAVVAAEVKGLATQTTRSTEEIANQVAGIQTATAAAVAAVGEIATTVEDVARISAAIAAAVEQQSAATQEIARNVQETGTAAEAVSARIADVSREAAASGAEAARVKAGLGEVTEGVASLGRRIVTVVRIATEAEEPGGTAGRMAA